jgi:DNA-binding response OmpR family regulator
MANIFLLEPDRVLARTYAVALEHAGHTVRWEVEAQAALDVLETFSADIIVLEVQLARHGGIEFLHELRSYPEWQELPVIINTNLTRQALEPVQNALQENLGVQVCLYKPRTSLHQLVKVVGERLAA